VVFNVFFEAKPFTTILIVHGTRGHITRNLSWAHVRPEGPKFETEGRERGRGSCGGAMTEPIDTSGIRGRPQMHFGLTDNPENAFSGHKCRLVPVSRFNSGEPLDAIGGILRFPGTRVENTDVTLVPPLFSCSLLPFVVKVL